MTHAAIDLADAVRAIARTAGQAILEVYHSGDLGVQQKADDSPLTRADLAAHRVIVDGLQALTPEIPVLSEESAQLPYAERRQWPRYWLVDPLDGTKEFISRNGEFTVNIALIAGHAPVLGVVHVPVSGTDYWGVVGLGAWRADGDGAKRRIGVRTKLGAAVRVVGSRSHGGDSLQAFLGRVGPHELVSMGSSLKICLVAEGAADVYPRLGPTSEWDTAAAHGVLLGAGGRLVQTDGPALQYNAKPELLNPFFVAYGSAERDWLALI